MLNRLIHQKQVAVWGSESTLSGNAGEEGGPPRGAQSVLSTLLPAAGLPTKQAPSVVHDHRGNTLYEEPCIAWVHLRISQARAAPRIAEGTHRAQP